MVMLERSTSPATNNSPLENKVVAAYAVATPQPHATFDMLAFDPILRDGIRMDLLDPLHAAEGALRRPVALGSMSTYSTARQALARPASSRSLPTSPSSTSTT